jgi:hypothetical protein
MYAFNSVGEVIVGPSEPSSHVNSLMRGRPTNTQHDEYMAFRREFLYLKERRPNMSERKEIWQRVKENYPHLPVGREPSVLEDGNDG